MPQAFSMLCHAYYVKNVTHRSKREFVNALLSASGCPYGINDPSQATRVFNGSGAKELPSSTMDCFQSQEVDLDSLAAFFASTVGKAASSFSSYDTAVQQIASQLALAHREQIAPQILFRSSALFFQNIVTQENKDLSIQQCYDLLLGGASEEGIARSLPLIPGDKAIVSKPPALQQHQVSVWTTFKHTWVIQNCGTVTWKNRTLRRIPSDNERMRRLNDSDDIPLPPTSPNQFVTLEAAFQSRGHEGKEISHWIMVTDTGEDCFPNMPTDFDVHVTINFSPTETGAPTT